LSAARRVVRTSSRFFEDLDRLLGSDRGLNGEPSVRDFQTIELLRIVDVFAQEFDDLPELIQGRRDYRVLITAGMLVPVITVIDSRLTVQSNSFRWAWTWVGTELRAGSA